MSSETDTESSDANPKQVPSEPPLGVASGQKPDRDRHGATEERAAASPAATGPAGALLEGHVGAQYLLPLLTGGEARGLPGISVKRVAFQRSGLGHPMDDIVITGVDLHGKVATLEVQAKRTLKFTASDPVFAEVVALACRTAGKPEFLTSRYELAVAIARSSTKIDQHIQPVLRWARDYQGSITFFGRLNQKGVASQEMRDFVATFRKNMADASASTDDENVWRLLSRFQVLTCDFEQPGSMFTQWTRVQCAAALYAADASLATELWDSLRLIALEINATGGDLDRASLLQRLTSERRYRLAEDPSRLEASRKNREATSASMQTAGSDRSVPLMQPRPLDTVIKRQSIYSAVANRLFGKNERPVAVRGMGGSGKTVLSTVLAWDERVEQHFQDGVLWATLGQSANLAGAIDAMLAALGLTPPPGDAAASSALLRSALAARRCLLVVDDVWAVEDVRLFLPGMDPAGCCLRLGIGESAKNCALRRLKLVRLSGRNQSTCLGRK